MRFDRSARLAALFALACSLAATAVGQTNRQKLELYNKIRRCTVRVEGSRGDKAWRGTGVGYARYGEYVVVVSNEHVATGISGALAENLTIQPYRSEKRLVASPLYCLNVGKVYLDIAFFVVSDPERTISIASTSSTPLKQGATVYACGHPLSESFLVGEGKVLSKKALAAEVSNNPNLIAHSALTEHGNSGGGLFDAAGNLVGINTWLLSDGTTGLSIDMALFKSWFILGNFSVDASQSGWRSIDFPAGSLSRERTFNAIALGEWHVDGSDATSAAGHRERNDGSSSKADTDFAFGALLLKASYVLPFNKRWNGPGYLPGPQATPTSDTIPAADVSEAQALVSGPVQIRVNDVDYSDNWGTLQVIYVLVGPPPAKRR